MFNEKPISEKEELAGELQKVLNTIVNHYVESGLVAKDKATSTLRDLTYNVEKYVSAAAEQSTQLGELEAFVLVNCELGFEQDLIQELSKLSGISDIKCVFGVYDLILKVCAGSESEIKEITARLRSMNHVKSTLTMMVIEN